jgi:5-formyltetrahydrofolate cyclo-ligase
VPSIPTSPADEKRALRARMLAERARLPLHERAVASKAIAERLGSLPAWRSASTVALYASMGAEVETADLARRAVLEGKRVVWPRLATREPAMEFAECAAADLAAGATRALEPPATAPVVPGREVDLVAVPGIAFDTRGGRLGRGRGHYDATLARLPRSAFRVGLAFESQIVPAVPTEPHDERLDALVTETRVLHAGDARGDGRG